MPWATGISVGASLLGGALGGSSKSGLRAQKDASAAAIRAQENAAREARTNIAPFLNNGTAAANALAQYYGIADPEGYAARPTRQQFEDQYLQMHYKQFGKGYNRNSDMSAVNKWVDENYNNAMKEWEAGKKQYIAENPGSTGSGEGLKAFTGNDLQNDPGYQFELAQGTKTNDAKAAAAGGFLSGAAQKEAIRYGNDFAGTKFNEAFSRDNTTKTRTANFLQSLANSGQSAATGQAQLSANTANQVGENLLGSANATAAASQADNNAWSNALGNIANTIGDYNVLSKIKTPSVGGQNPSYSKIPTYSF